MSGFHGSHSDLPEAWRSPDDFPEPYTNPNETLEVARKSEEKELAPTREDYAPEALCGESPSSTSSPPSRQLKRRRRWIYIATVVLLILTIALGVGLGVGSSRSSAGNDRANASDSGSGSGANSDSSTSTSSVTPESTISQPPTVSGAVNGTGIAVTRLARLDKENALQDENIDTNALMVYQHRSGELRWIQHLTGTVDAFRRGNSSHVVASDAKMGTSIDSMLSGDGASRELHVFYVGLNNALRQRSLTLGSSTWADGPLNELNASVLNSSHVALTVGLYGGGSDCMMLFVGASNSTIDEWAWCPDGDWQLQHTWTDVNGRATPAYRGFTMSTDATTYVAFLDLEDNVRLYWRNTSDEAAAPPSETLNGWTLAPNFTLSNLSPTLGLNGLSEEGTLLGLSTSTNQIMNVNVTLAASNSTVSTSEGSWSWKPSQPLLENSQFKVISRGGGPEQIVLFYQVESGDVEMAWGSVAEGPGPGDTLTWPT